MNHIIQNINELRSKIPQHVTIVAVSKTVPVRLIRKAFEAGQLIFGESRVQQLAGKYEQIPDARWHLIGHLQTNKVKMVVGKVSMIHSIDSERLLWAVAQEARKQGIEQRCLLEFHVAMEESKSGFSIEELSALTSNSRFNNLSGVTICGVMGMASFTEDEQQIRAEFRMLKQYFDHLKRSTFADNREFRHLSMGMSGDWPIAIEEGSTLIRVGSNIFGKHR